jgi:O-antigen/teichoic acid export membrane protein
MQKQARRIARGSFSVILASLSIIVASIFFNAILFRLLGISSYGAYAILLSIYGIAMPLVTLGIFNSVRKHMGEVTKSQKKKVAGCGYLLSLIYSIFTFSLGCVVVLLLWENDIIEKELVIPFFVIVIALTFFAFYETSRSILYGLHKESRAESLRIIERLIAYATGLSLIYLGFGILGVFLGILFSLMIMAVVGYMIVNNYIKINFNVMRAGFSKYRYELVSFGGLTLISLLLAQALYHSDILLIGFLLNDTTHVGAYKAALVLAEMLWLIPVAFQIVLLHYVSEMWKKKKLNELRMIIQEIAKYVTLAMILFGFGLMVLAGPFLKIYYGPGVEDSVLPLQILILGSLGFGLARIINPIIEGTGHIIKGIRISAGIVALNIGLNILLIPIYGIVGAAIATSISYFAKLIQYVYLLRKLKIRILRNFPTKKIFILAVVFLFILHLTFYLPITDTLLLLVVPPIGLATFVIISRLLGLWEWGELRKVISLLR